MNLPEYREAIRATILKYQTAIAELTEECKAELQLIDDRFFEPQDKSIARPM